MEGILSRMQSIGDLIGKSVGEDNEEKDNDIEGIVYSIWQNHCTTGETWEEYRAKHIGASQKEKAQRLVDAENEVEGHLNELDGYDCPICKNKGMVFVLGEYMGNYRDEAEYCLCQPIRKNILRLKASGLQNGLGKFEDFVVEQPFQQYMLDKAKEYLTVSHDKGQSIYFGGTPGCGKTMLGSAICRELINRGHDVLYMPWITETTKIKSLTMDERQSEYIDKFKTVEYLYIDDFFKPIPGQANPSPADVKLAYDIINYRYINRLPMIISSEKPLNELGDLDEATISRLSEMAKGFVVSIAKQKGRNWRLKDTGVTV